MKIKSFLLNHIGLVELILFITFWQSVDVTFLPKPTEVWVEFVKMYKFHGLINDAVVSLSLALLSTAIVAIIGSMISYLYFMPKVDIFVKPIINVITKFRYATLPGVILFIVLLFDVNDLKIIITTFVMLPWFINGMISEIEEIKKEKLDFVRTIGYSETGMWYYVVVYGTRDKILKVLASITAISWNLLTSVENLARHEGGLGTILQVSKRTYSLDKVLVVLIMSILLGLCIELLLKGLRKFIFRYSTIGKELNQWMIIHTMVQF